MDDANAAYNRGDYTQALKILRALAAKGNAVAVREELSQNIHIHDGVTQEQFVEMRNKRDVSLEMPVLILPAIQINIRAGEMPPKEGNGVSYAKIPLNLL
jgi:hypothetical protein